MKYVIAVIRPEKLDEVKEALRAVDVSRMTVTEVQGYGRQRGYLDEVLGMDKGIRFVRKIKLEIAVNDEFLEPTIKTILRVARTDGGRVGDGKIFILPLENVIRISTGEEGREAI
ncbi:MAG: P-II family nitrogen regulator [Brevinematia bacterium]